LVARLRSPEGCPWDREQAATDLRAYLLEEAHEAAAAIDSEDWPGLCAELGDLLFQIIFLSFLAWEGGHFELATVVDNVHDKMVTRHPHVFGEQRLEDAASVRQAWERRKLADRRRASSLLEGVAPSLPALVAAYRLTQKAAGVGFDWPTARAVLGKLEEEIDELKDAIARRDTLPHSDDIARQVREEIGDLLFTLANLSRHLGVDPEGALAQSNLKFRRRFEHIEREIEKQGRRLEETALGELDALWDEAKSAVSRRDPGAD
jgi:MazG family protein